MSTRFLAGGQCYQLHAFGREGPEIVLSDSRGSEGKVGKDLPIGNSVMIDPPVELDRFLFN